MLRQRTSTAYIYKEITMMNINNTPIPNHIRLQQSYDLDRLNAELKTIVAKGWNTQKPFSASGVDGLMTTVYHEGNWKIISLRSLGGDDGRTDPGGPALVDYAYTSYSDGAPYIRSILDQFDGYVRTTRLSVLNPGENIDPHCDTYIALRYGQVRLHVPIVTNEDTVMTIGGEDSHWSAGQLWFGDFSKHHSVVNNGDSPRVHLIFDVYIYPKLLSLFPQDFVESLNKNQILLHKNELEIPTESLQKYECDFLIPSGLVKGIFEFDDGIPGEYAGKIMMHGKRLALFLKGTPIFSLVPVAEDEFRLLGWSMERTMVFEFNQNKVSNLSIKMNRGSRFTKIDLPVTI